MINHDNENFPEVFFRKMKDIEEKFLTFLEKQDEIDESFIIFNEYLKDQKISEKKYELKSFLYLINAISSNYHRSQHFFSKIESILNSLQEKIKDYFMNFEIFNIFQRNKRLLLSLIKLGILIPTNEIYSIIKYKNKFKNAQYIEYFYPELEPFINNKEKISIRNQIPELADNSSIDEFNKKRENGENDNYICELIRNDSVVEFITFIEKKNISPSSTIQPSIYETNLFLLNGTHELINYSAFYGSLQILRYLFYRNVEINSSIWLYAIHGRNAELIRFLEENRIETLQGTFQYLIIESIECHHNEFADYFINNFCQKEKIYNFYLYRKALKFYNFSFLNDEIVNSLIDSCKFNQKLNIPYYLAKYDYFLIVEFIFKLTQMKKFLFFKKSKKILDVNHQYTILRPVNDVFSNDSFDVVKSIEIKNGDIEEVQFENEDQYDEVLKYYIKMEKERIKYKKYKYEEETSTILNLAARKGNIDIIQFCLNTPKIDVNIRSKINHKGMNEIIPYYSNTNKKTVLIEAVESGYTEVVQFLLKNKSFDVNCVQLKKSISVHEYRFNSNSNDKETLLHLAIEREYIEIIKLLLSNQKIDVNLKSVSVLEECGGCDVFTSSKKRTEKSSLYYAIESRNIKIVQLLLSHSEIDLNSGIKEEDLSNGMKILHEETPLCLAVNLKNLEMVQLLLKQHKIDVNYESTFSICQNNEEVIVKKTALMLASELQDSEIYQFLLSKKKNV